MKKTTVLIAMLAMGVACKKFLDKIADPSQATPDNIAALQAILDNNDLTVNSTPGIGVLGTGDYYMTDSLYRNVESFAQDAYTWQSNVSEEEQSVFWSAPYKAIRSCNTVLDALPGIPLTNSNDSLQARVLKGMGLFTRAFHFYFLEETFGQVYKPGSANKDMGILLRMHPDPQQIIGRSTVAQVYDQMISDLHLALPLSPDSLQTLHRNRPSKAAVLALLSRIFLSMQQYDSSLIYADSSLIYYKKLVDYNAVNTTSKRAFSPLGNDEVLFQCTSADLPGQRFPPALVDTQLYNMYDLDDLRRDVFFRAAPDSLGHYMKGGYSGSNFIFSGLSVDEVYLTKAECLARKGLITAASFTLNTLLAKRYRNDSFKSYVPSNLYETLKWIILERRKETVFRETRWPDLRRLNQDPRFADTLIRRINKVDHILLPGDPRYSYLIPEEELKLGNIEQNPR